MAKQTTGLELAEDAEFQRREWVVERVGWVLLGVVLASAVLGLFGGGPLSQARVTDQQQTFEVTYERFTRALTYTVLEITVDAGAIEDSSVTVYLSDTWIDNVTTWQITPEPDSTTRTDEGIFYEFATRPNSPLVATLLYRPNDPGISRSAVGIGDSERVELWQLVYP